MSYHEKNMDIIEFESPTINEKGEIIAWTHHSAERFTKDLGNGVDLGMVIIPAGIFQMGSTPRYGNDDERPQHLVTIKSFAMGEHPVTQAEWKAVMGKLPPCRFKGDLLPVERVSWDEVQKFCHHLSNKTGRSYGLPSEAEWEYACRAGTTSPFSFGETLTTELANYNGEHIFKDEPRGLYRHHTTEVDSFPPNAFGIRDMHGNVWEWCSDSWLDDYAPSPKDYSSDQNRDSRYRVARGGSWHEPPALCRSAARIKFLRSDADEFIGFRVVCENN